MNLVLVAIFTLFCFAIFSLLVGNKKGKGADLVRVLGPIISSLLGIVPVIKVLCGINIEPIIFPWFLFEGSFYLEIDSLSAFFLLPVFILAFLASIYGHSYLKHYSAQRNLGVISFFFNLFIMSMVLVVCSQNAFLFLLSWELMALTSFFLVMFENEKSLTKWTGWLYLSLTHIGTACLFVFFFVMADGSLTTNFSDMAMYFDGNQATLCFVLALIGFGTKAGIMPFHIWLPEAHPAAPAHVSSVMSGVMIKIGIYGLLRFLFMMGGHFELWWGIVLVILGAISGVLGILFALAQHDLKRLLAYSSVENIGIIFLSLGIGFIGLEIKSPVLGVMGFAGAFLHILNHSFFKGLLFFCAGSIIHSTHVYRMDQLGGVLKKMPLTAFAFLVGSISICGLPPFNGFIGELMIYMGSFKEIIVSDFANVTTVIPIFAIISLVMIGGLAALCFAKAFSVIFLGEPRYKISHEIKESPASMITPIYVLCGLCLLIGVFPELIIPVLKQVISPYFSIESVDQVFLPLERLFRKITIVYCGMGVLIILFTLIRKFYVNNRNYQTTVTWDCGYIRPQATMQYTSSSFGESLINLFSFVLKTKKKFAPPSEYFPIVNADLNTRTKDTIAQKIYLPAYNFFNHHMYKLLKIQYGNINLYIFYIIVALVILLSVNMLTRNGM